MSEALCFTHLCEALERSTSLDRLQARGTVRLALKQGGLDPARVTPRELSVVIAKILPGELATRGVATPEAVCRELAAGLSTLSGDTVAETPESVFRRLAGDLKAAPSS